MLPFLKKTLLSDSSASNRNILSKSTKETEGGASLVAHGKESTCQCGKHGFHPWSRKIPHASEQLNLCATNLSLSSRAQELQLLMREHSESVLCNKKSHRHEKPHTATSVAPAHCNQRKPTHSNEDLAKPKINIFLKNKRREREA